jgi:hypothetical protein
VNSNRGSALVEKEAAPDHHRNQTAVRGLDLTDEGRIDGLSTRHPFPHFEGPGQVIRGKKVGQRQLWNILRIKAEPLKTGLVNEEKSSGEIVGVDHIGGVIQDPQQKLHRRRCDERGSQRFFC